MQKVRIWLGAIMSCVFGMVVIGGITRLTQSGLSIVDWKPIMGALPPMTAAQWQEAFDRYKEFPQFKIQFPQMVLAEFKWIFFWEYIHRLLGRMIGVVVLVPGVYFWIKGALPRTIALRVAGGFALGGLQGLLGWYMVKSGLVNEPRVSHFRLAAHLGVALIIFVYFAWLFFDLERLALRDGVASQGSQGVVNVGGQSLGWTHRLFWALLSIQIFYGALVAGLRAGWGYNTFPLMDGSFIPSDFWLLTPDWSNFFYNRTTVQWTHRFLGWGLCCAALFVYLDARKKTKRQVLAGAVLLGLVLGQFTLGAMTLITVVSIPVAVLHQGFAVVVLFWMVYVSYEVKRGSLESTSSG